MTISSCDHFFEFQRWSLRETVFSKTQRTFYTKMSRFLTFLIHSFLRWFAVRLAKAETKFAIFKGRSKKKTYFSATAIK